MNDNFTKNIEIMRKNLHRGMTEAQALKVINTQETQLKNAMQWTVESSEYIAKMRETVRHYIHGTTVTATDAMRQLGVHVVRVK